MLKPKSGTGPLGFFRTARGRYFVFLGAGATTIGLFMGNFLPHSVGLRFYRDFVQCYENGMERAVPAAVQDRLEKAFELLKVPKYERTLIKPFTVFGFDLFQAGSTKYRFGCALGIPVNYGFEQPADIRKGDIQLRGASIDWNTEGGRLLQDSIVLTEAEQIFGFCKSILQLQTHRVLMNAIFPSVSFLTVYTVGSYLNQRLNLMARPASMRFFMYLVLGMFGYGSWSFMKDYNQVQYDSAIDKQLSAMGPDFVAAGVSYYDKTLKKNIALRMLTGEETYTAKGNENYFIRQKSLPLTIRKSFFENKWREMRESAQPTAEEAAAA